MKKLFTILAVAATLVSCAKEDVVREAEGEAIQFGNAFVDNATRATDNTYGNVALTKFNVYGTVQGTGNGVVNIFDGDVVTGAVGQNVWSCDVKQYWIAGATYNFAAVVDATVGTNDTANGMPVTLTTQADDATEGNMNLKDMLYATAGPITGAAENNQKVNFTFSHLLAKAQFTVKSNTEGGYYYSVKDIKVSNFETGTYTINGGTWAGTTAKDIAFGNIEKVTKADTNGKTNATQMLLIPTTTDFKVSFTVEIWNENGDGDADDVLLGTTSYTGDAAKIVSQDLVAGHVYDFNLDLKVGELIQFTVTSNPTWEGETDVNVTL